jgi:hypothetical protein
MFLREEEGFEPSLAQKVKPHNPDNFYGTFSINGIGHFKKEVVHTENLVGDDSIVISPYPEVKAKIESAMKRGGT